MDTHFVVHNQCYQCHLGQFLKKEFDIWCRVQYICQVQNTSLHHHNIINSFWVVRSNAPGGQLHPSWQWSSHVSLAEGLEHVSGQELMHSLNSMLLEQFLSVNRKWHHWYRCDYDITYGNNMLWIGPYSLDITFEWPFKENLPQNFSFLHCWGVPPAWTHCLEYSEIVWQRKVFLSGALQHMSLWQALIK